MSDLMPPPPIIPPRSVVELDDLAALVVNEIRHHRRITLAWARRTGKRALWDRVVELHGSPA